MNNKSLEIILERFAEFGEAPCIGFREKEITYSRLLQLVEEQTQMLTELGVKSGDVVVLIADYSPESTAAIFALARISAIMVPLLPVTIDRTPSLMDIVRPKYILKQEIDGTISTSLTNTAPLEHEMIDELRKREAPGLILFTSGSSGEPKAVIHDLSLLLEKFQTIRKSYRSLNFLLFDHWGGLNTLFSILSSGNFLALPEERGADYICSLIERYKLELLPTSPSFLNLLLWSGVYKSRDLSSLKLISYGSEPMPASTLTKLNEVFPNLEFRQTYGLIELGVLRAKSESKDSLWVKIGGNGYDIRIKDGLLEIKAESAMLGYLNAPSPFTEDGYFMTGDRVEQKGEYYRILGRASELINVGGQKVFPTEVEDVLLQSDLVQDAAVFGDPHPLTGKIVCARIVLSKEMDLKKTRLELKRHCAAHLDAFKVPVKMVFVEAPVQSHRMKRFRR